MIRRAEYGFALLFCLSMGALYCTGTGAPQREPYLIFVASKRSIYRMNLNGSGLHKLLQDSSTGVQGVDYHYRLGLLFWTNTMDHTIKKATLEGSHIQIIANSSIDYPTDVVVDWINDKIYWTDRDRKIIEMYDLQTEQRTVIYSTGQDSLPIGLAIFPYPGSGWLYWTNMRTGTLERVSVEGSRQETILEGLKCVWSLTLNFLTHTIYWADSCKGRVESNRMDGAHATHTVLATGVLFSFGIAVFESSIYWTQINGVYTIDESTIEKRLVETSDSGSQGIQVVHSSKQPATEQYLTMVRLDSFSCSPPCASGDCIGVGLCGCHSGWIGLDCSMDMDECSADNGGCTQLCTNQNGSHTCACSEGYVLDINQRGCLLQESNTSLSSNVHTIMSTTLNVPSEHTSLQPHATTVVTDHSLTPTPTERQPSTSLVLGSTFAHLPSQHTMDTTKQASSLLERQSTPSLKTTSSLHHSTLPVLSHGTQVAAPSSVVIATRTVVIPVSTLEDSKETSGTENVVTFTGHNKGLTLSPTAGSSFSLDSSSRYAVGTPMLSINTVMSSTSISVGIGLPPTDGSKNDSQRSTFAIVIAATVSLGALFLLAAVVVSVVIICMKRMTMKLPATDRTSHFLSPAPSTSSSQNNSGLHEEKV